MDSITEQANKDTQNLTEQLTTKADFNVLKSDLKNLEIDFKNSLKETEITFIKWLITSQLTLAAVILAIFALFMK